MINKIADSGGFPEPAFYEARRAAADLIKKSGLKEPPVDPRKIASFLGVKVTYADFPNEFENISGYIKSDKNHILVNAHQNTNRMFYTIAHELGHHCMHKSYVTSNSYRVLPRNDKYENGKPPEEVEADIFAANLLVPFPLLKKYNQFASVSELSRLFMVSEDVVKDQLYWMKATRNG